MSVTYLITVSGRASCRSVREGDDDVWWSEDQ